MGLLLLPPERVKMGCCFLPPDRVKLTVKSKKETSSRVKMSQGSRWASVINPLKESKWAAIVYPCQSQSKSEQQERNKRQGQNGPRAKMGFCYLPLERVKMGCCCLPPDRVKLTVKSKKETNSRVKMVQEPKWAKGQDGLLLFTP